MHVVSDYLIDHEDFDWPVILADWVWLLPEQEITIWLMNRYGDLFLVSESNQAVYMLDVGIGSCKKVAQDRDDFCRRVDEMGRADDWLMVSLVNKLVVAGKVLEPGRCYSFIIPPVLGGGYSVENTATLSVVEHYGVCASIHKQIKDLPDGERVRLRVEA